MDSHSASVRQLSGYALDQALVMRNWGRGSYDGEDLPVNPYREIQNQTGNLRDSMSSSIIELTRDLKVLAGGSVSDAWRFYQNAPSVLKDAILAVEPGLVEMFDKWWVEHCRELNPNLSENE